MNHQSVSRMLCVAARVVIGLISCFGVHCIVTCAQQSIARAPRESIYPPDVPLCCPGIESVCDVSVTGTLIGDLTVNVALQQIGSPTYLNMTVSNTMTVAGQTCAPYVQADHNTVQDELFANYYSHGHDYQILSSDKTIFSSFGNELIVTPTDPVVGDQFGQVVAMSADGSVVVVGAPQKNGTQGVAYILQRNFAAGSPTWPSVQEIVDPALTAGDFFGTAVAVSSDGFVIAIVAQGPGGSVLYIYTYNTATNQWSLTQPGITYPLNTSSQSVSMSGSGKYIVIVDGAATPVAHVYARQDNCSALSALWILQQNISTAVSLTNNTSVSMSPDGKMLAIGLPFRAPANVGVIHIYGRASVNVIWSLQQIIAPLGTTNFGYSVSLSGDGQYLLTGTPATGANGTAYMYVQRGPQWLLENTFTPSSGANYGSVVSLSADGSVAAMSSTTTTGVVDVWLRAPDNLWALWFSFVGHNPTDAFGTGLSVSSDGAFFAAGAPDSSGATSGTVSVFRPVGAIIPENASVTGNLCVDTGVLTVNSNVQIAGNLTMSGVIAAPGGVVPCTPSDYNIKQNIRSLQPEYAMSVLHALRPVEFSWIHPHEHREGARRTIGFIAQELEKIRPEWVQQRMPSGDDAALFAVDEEQRFLFIKPDIFAYFVAVLQELDRRAEERMLILKNNE